MLFRTGCIYFSRKRLNLRSKYSMVKSPPSTVLGSMSRVLPPRPNQGLRRRAGFLTSRRKLLWLQLGVRIQAHVLVTVRRRQFWLSPEMPRRRAGNMSAANARLGSHSKMRCAEACKQKTSGQTLSFSVDGNLPLASFPCQGNASRVGFSLWLRDTCGFIHAALQLLICFCKVSAGQL